MADQDPYAATAIKPTAKKAKAAAAPAGDPYAATAVQAAAPVTTPLPPTQPTPSADWRDRVTQVTPHNLKSLLPGKNGQFDLGSYAREVGTSLSNIGASGLGLLLHPVASAQSFAASLTPSSVMHNSLDDWQKNVIDPWQKTHPGQPVPENLQLSDHDRQLADTPDPFTSVAASLLPSKVIDYGKSHGREGQIRAKQARGETLSADDQSYLDHATRLEGMGGYPLETVEQGVGQAGVTAGLEQAIPKVLRGAQATAEGTVRRLAGSGPGVARDLVRQVADDNRKIGLHNADRVADAQQTWQEKQAKANTDHQAELLRLRQKYAQDTRAAAEKARTGTDADRASYQSKQLAAKQKYDQAVRDQTEKFQTERVAAQKANAEAQRAYNQKIGETAQHNRETTAAERAKSDQAARLQVGGSQLIYGLRQLDKALRAKANDLYGAVREKMAGASLPSDTLADGVKAAQAEWIRGSPAKVAEFNAMMSPGQPGPELVLADQTAQNMGYKDFRTAISNPAIRSTLSRALPPDVWDAAIGQGTRPISWNDLQGFYEETGAKIADGPQPGKGDIYKAIQQVHQFVGDQMQQLADAQGVGPQHRAARAFYRDYMNTFHEPTGPSSSGSPVAQALLAKDPLVAADKFAGDSGDRGIAILRRYSDSLANLAQDVRQRAQAKVEVPARKSATSIPAPKVVPVPAGANLPLPGVVESAPAPRAANLPLPSVMPDAEVVPYREPKLSPTRTISADDLQRANEASVQHRGSSAVGSLIRLSVVWPAFHLLSDLMRGREVSPGGLAAIPAAGATGMAIEEVLAHPGVKEFLIKPSRAQIAQIPLDLRGEMPSVVQAARAHGVPVSPLLAAYVAAIQRNQSQQSQQPPQNTPTAQGVAQ